MTTPPTPALSVTLRASFETAHRLPHLPGKCQSLHGHSWLAEVTICAPRPSAGDTVVEFRGFRAAMRGWIDGALDHATLLGADDPLIDALREQGCKVYVFGRDPGTTGYRWPTVEAVACLIARHAPPWLTYCEEEPTTAPGAQITRVTVRETPDNAATWQAGP